ncbi:MAG TPA: GGDEF domain-containing protein, partial [Phycisphaerae bacterium]|nr:GGDEF domain-containing protein [Phycisphaerae bacterium]
EILRRLGEALRRGVRTTDVLARYGGDEFVLLMPETMLAQAETVLERLRECACSVPSSSGRPVTISCGVAEWSGRPADTGAEVLRRADRALYQAKRSGRNRVTVGSEPTPTS